MTKIYKIVFITFIISNQFLLSQLQAQNGDNCLNAISFSTCDTTIILPGISTTSGSNVGSVGNNAFWYIFTAPKTGAINVTSCNNGGVNTELAIHDLGSNGDCSSAGNPSTFGTPNYCASGNPQLFNAAQITNINVIAGNKYAIEWGDVWTNNGFTWNLYYPIDPCNNSSEIPNALANADTCITINSCNDTLNFTTTINTTNLSPIVTLPDDKNVVWYKFISNVTGDLTVNSCDINPINTDTDLGFINVSQLFMEEHDDGGCDPYMLNIYEAFTSSFTTPVNVGDTILIEWGDQWFSGPFNWIAVVNNCETLGCTDSLAVNFDPYATLDDGSCSYCNQIRNLSGLIITGTYEADDQIICSGQINSGSGGPVYFYAGANPGGLEYIELINNFDADGTVDFEAINIQCDFTD